MAASRRRALRDKVAWYGEAELVPHLLNVLATGAIDVTLSWGEAVGYGMAANRKEIARDAETAVRRMTARALRSPPAQPSDTEEGPASCRSCLRPNLTDKIMEIRNLGGSGLRVSAVGMGATISASAAISKPRARSFTRRSISASRCSTPPTSMPGAAARRPCWAKCSGDRRKDIVLATKYSKAMSNDGTKQGASRRYIMNAVEDSLRPLKTDYIDLYQQHDYDPLTALEETLRALEDLIRQGKVRYIGCSNFPRGASLRRSSPRAASTPTPSCRARTNTA